MLRSVKRDDAPASACAPGDEGRDMIGRISGQLISKQPPMVLVDAHGVGYELEAPMSTFYKLPATGEAVRV